MPLSMTLNRSNNLPLLTPCYDGKELHIDSELVSAGLSAISVKGCDAGDPKSELGIRHRNSFWSVHRPELSKLGWAYDHTTQNIENYSKIQTGNHQTNKEFGESNVSPTDLDQLTVIHANFEQHENTDEHYSIISKPQTMQFSDDDLASHTTLHKSRAEFCVTIGHLAGQSISESREPSGSVIEEENEERNSFYENDESLSSCDTKIDPNISPEQIAPVLKKMQINEDQTPFSESHNKQFDGKRTDEKLPKTSQDMLITFMDTAKDKQAF